MKDFSIAMALADYLPVILYAVAAIMLQRDLYNKMSKGAFALFAAGTIDVFSAGALKATYKLLYAAGICDFEPRSELFFPMQAIGMLLAGIGVVAAVCHRQGVSGVMAAAAAPVKYRGTMLFVVLMVLGLTGMNAGLSFIAIKMKKPLCVVMFVLSLIFSLGMGYLSSKDFTQSYMNWAAEGVNIVGQGSLLAGTLLLHKAGLAGFTLKSAKSDT